MPYLTQLIAALKSGLATLPEADRRRHAAFLRAQQRPDGGFPGRQGGSDPYYTAFALRGLAVLDALDAATARRAAEYLATAATDISDLVTLHAVATSSALIRLAAAQEQSCGPPFDRDWFLQKTRDVLAPLTRDDGWARSPRGGPSSTYQTFLAITLLDALDRLPDEPRRERIAAMIADRQRVGPCSPKGEDGGFVELPPMTSGGTNPTAAAVGTLSILDRLDRIDTTRAADFLVAMQMPDGGVRAHGRIDAADLLSTFTALVTLERLGQLERLDRPALRRFTARLARREGGFAAAEVDPACDCEYTFYGLGCLLAVR